MSSRDMTAEQQAADEAERRLFHAELLKFEASRGYRVGWSYRTFCARFGCSPPREWNYDQQAQWIRPETYAWIRGRLLDYAEARAAKTSRSRRPSSKSETYR